MFPLQEQQSKILKSSQSHLRLLESEFDVEIYEPEDAEPFQNQLVVFGDKRAIAKASRRLKKLLDVILFPSISSFSKPIEIQCWFWCWNSMVQTFLSILFNEFKKTSSKNDPCRLEQRNELERKLGNESAKLVYEDLWYSFECTSWIYWNQVETIPIILRHVHFIHTLFAILCFRWKAAYHPDKWNSF